MENTELIVKVLLPVFVLQMVLMITALMSCLKQTNTKGPKWLWVVVIVCFNIIGPVAYFLFGRKEE
ncbi:MAG: PLD nuclease N-terminal domain-containing protein [Bacillus sp. (in: firmicutes)]